MPATPEWTPVADYPSLKGSQFIGIDLETKDPNLEAMGPGSFRRDGHIAGISISTEAFTRYYPIGHEGGGNLPKDVVLRWLKRELAGNEQKIGANIGYDLEWLASEGIKVNGPKRDVQVAEALIDENQDDYTLDRICHTHLGRGKDERLLRDAAALQGWRTDKQVKQNLWRLPSKFVGPYAEFDALGAVEVYKKQLVLMQEEELMPVFDLESKLVDVLLDMRIRGIPISYDKAEQAIAQLNKELGEAQKRLNHLAGFGVDCWSSKSLAALFDKQGLAYPRTEKGNPSFVADWLEAHPAPLAQDIVLVRKLDRSANVFIQKKIVDLSVRGRLHPSFKQTRREDGGTRSGRLASAAPNMQQVPARHPILAPLVRGIFVADPGTSYGVFDYSQQEPRVTLHYACLREYKGAEEALRRYIANPRIDYHQMVADMAHEITGNPIGRKAAKTLNLGMAYGMGVPKLAANLGLTVGESKPVFDAYHAAVPYVRLLGDDAMRQAKRRGWIKTLLGRRRHFPGGEFAHKALNAAVQGSSADMIKKAMVDIHEAGHQIYNTVHDELDLPIRDKAHAKEIAHIMTTGFDLLVPLAVDVELGPSWGEAEACEV